MHDPDNAPTLNYLGYMLADRGERLDESVAFLKKALAIDPENGSYLDSLGWAYYKSNKFDLAVDNLKRAAGQLKSNSVIQDHYGDVLFKLGRYDEAIEAWTRALAGDGDSVDRPEESTRRFGPLNKKPGNEVVAVGPGRRRCGARGRVPIVRAWPDEAAINKRSTRLRRRGNRQAAVDHMQQP